MAAFANVASANTFAQWRERTNEVIERLNNHTTSNTVLFASTLTANTTLSVPATGMPYLANTNAFIATKLNSSSYTTADVQAKAALANTNTFIATKLNSSSYTTADVQAKAALANTNTFIGTKLDSSSYTTADVQAKAALANTNAFIATKAAVANVVQTTGGNFTGNVTFANTTSSNGFRANFGGPIKATPTATLLIQDSGGSTLKTINGIGSN